MLELKPKAAQAQAARTLARSFELVQYKTTTYIPADWLTEAIEPLPDIDSKIWLPLSRSDKRQLANQKSNILFASDSELSNFDYMLRQFAHLVEDVPDGIFIRTTTGLRILTESGELIAPDGRFLPNFLKPVLNDDAEQKAEVFAVIVEWLGSEDEAHSLLYHLATALVPTWSAVKYILLLGDGRNGKSLLLKMLVDLFGSENVSHVSRQNMAEQLPVVTELNGKLLNVIFDGKMDYIKDSGLEKTLIAGEPGYVRLLYESGLTRVQTNALFIEGLNKEPKSRDKSQALQKRLVRFYFPNRYPLNYTFEQHMRSPKMLGALLSLLLDHFVRKDEIVEKLSPSKSSVELQLNQMYANSPVFQFIEYLVSKDPSQVDKWIGEELDPYVTSFMAWRISEGFGEYSSADTVNMFRDCFEVTWKTVRKDGKYARVRYITGIKPDTELLLMQLKEGETEDGTEAPDALVPA